MAKPVTHFSRIRQIGDRTVTGTLCNRMANGADINCTTEATDVTCKLCQLELLSNSGRPDCYSRLRGSFMERAS